MPSSENYEIEIFGDGVTEHVVDKLKQYDDRPNGVTATQLANGAVITEKLDDSAVTAQKMAQNAVTTPKIAGGAVTDDKLDPGGIISDLATLRQDIQSLDVTVDVDDFRLEQDSSTGLVYVVYRGERGSDGIPLAGGGGGGGGGGGNNAVLTVTNESGWLARTISTGATCNITIAWSSVEEGLPTGDGTMTVSVAGIPKSTQTVSQGTVVMNVGPMLAAGTSKVRVQISDVYENTRTITFTITSVELSLLSSFDTSSAFTAGQPVEYTYVPKGALEKTVHFVVDGTELPTETVTVSGRQQGKTLPGMQHGSHTLLVYFTATIDGQTVSSNELYYDLLVVSPTSNVPIIASPFRQTGAVQYEMLSIPFTAYTPNSLTSAVQLLANGTVVSEITVGRTEQTWSYRCTSIGQLALQIKVGTITKDFALTVAESEIDVHAETQDLALYLSSYGRSNGEATPEVWEDEDNEIAATLTGFDFVTNGWVRDADGFTALRVNNGARVTIPYQPFARDFRLTGKTLEVEFAVRDVLDYDAVALDCMSAGRGLSLTAQFATLASEQTTIRTQYKEDAHVRVSFVAEKRAEDRLLLIYINGVVSGAVQYPENDDFSQLNPVDITIGDDGITTDVYCIRVYDNDLTRHQMLDNWIADTQDADLMLERYRHNNVYDEYGEVVIEKLPTDLPYFILEAAELPQYKGDKKTITGSYVDSETPARSFTFDGCQINVQGTSSAPYYRKNYDMQFKNGFLMRSGTKADNYALAANVIPFNRFVLKADVASSESANNVELVKLYNDLDPYIRPERAANQNVRDGIYGFPIVVFWHDTENDVTHFMGKYNFNLPKRAPEPYGYSGDMESWEFQNNTSPLMLFKADYFDPTMRADPTTGESKETWRYDYEARFPSDEWVDTDKLQELQTFVYSTYRANATGDALASPVTYGGVTYSTDSADYRLARFRAEFGNYAEVQSFLYYYVFTELFLMVDSRAKNLFIGFSGSQTTGLQHIDRKAVAEPYDMDTAIGTNNEGSLVFGYSLEDTDTVAGANVFNGQESVLWCNLRDAFPGEIASTYQTLRASGGLSYDMVEQRFEAHQDKWPEAIFNEDAWVKYLEPLIDPQGGKEPSASYLPMLQGSKEEQRKWWLYNRFRYMDSKWLAGNATANRIQLRGYAKADITVTPYADIYAVVQFGSYYVSERGTHGVPVAIESPNIEYNDTEIYIHSAQEIMDVGDLSGLKVGFNDFSQANKLTRIVVGSAAQGYTNDNLTNLTVGTNRLLSTVDVRNCVNLAGSVDLSGAANIEHAYFAGTKVTSVTLPAGGILKTLQLPATVTNLTVIRQPNITSFSFGGTDYSSISTLRVENSGSSIPVLDILDDMVANSRVRIIGFTTTASSTSEVEDFFDYLDTMRGLDEAGIETAKPVVSGTITGLGTITGAWLAEMNERYPDVTIRYEHISSTLSYYSWDGGTLLHTETVTDGGNGTWDGTPTRTSTAQYSYTFAGWSRYTDQSTADPTATQSVGADRSVYAAYTATTRTYTVTWKNADNTTLETDQNVPYGTTPTYNGATPTYQGETSTGWNPAVAVVTGDQTYTAVYIPTYQVQFYNGSTLLQTSRVQEGGTAVYSGSTPTHSESYMQFTGWDKALTNIRADTDFYAQYRDTRSAVIQYVEGALENYFSDTATTVAAYAFRGHANASTTNTPYTATTTATSIGMYAFASNIKLTTVDLTNTGAINIANNAFNGCKKLSNLVIRSASIAGISSSNVFNGTAIARGDGAIFVPDLLVDSYKTATFWRDYVILPLSEYPTTDYSSIRDSWSDIIAATNNGTANKYSVGDTKLLDVGTEGKVYAQVAKVDNTGLTFVTKSTLATKHRMNPANSSGAQGTGANGGWEYSEMRAYLSNTVFALFPAELQTAITTETKYSDNTVPGETSVTHNGCVTQDKLWLLSAQEVFGGTSYETQGEHYSALFPNTNSRIKYDQSSLTSSWWLRSAYSNNYFCRVHTNGTVSNNDASSATGVVLGFTIGHHPTEQEKWEALKNSITNGTLKQKYAIGDTIPLTIGTEGKVEMQIAAFDEDTSHVTFISKGLLATNHRMNPANDGTQGTGGNGGWEHSEMRTYLNDTILPLVPSFVSGSIVPITKYSDGYANSAIVHDETTTDKLWIPSAREVFGGTSYEQTGPVYGDLFTSQSSLIKYDQSGSPSYWWIRSAYSATSFRLVGNNGSTANNAASGVYGVVLCFCL